MFDEKDLIIDARHITRRFPAAGGKELTACNDINLQLPLLLPLRELPFNWLYS